MLASSWGERPACEGVEPPEDGGSVAAAPGGAGADGDALGQGDAQVLPSLAGGPAEGQSGGHGQVTLVVGQKAQAGLRPNPAGEAQVEGDLIAEGDRLHHHLHLVVSVGPGP